MQRSRKMQRRSWAATFWLDAAHMPLGPLQLTEDAAAVLLSWALHSAQSSAPSAPGTLVVRSGLSTTER